MIKRRKKMSLKTNTIMCADTYVGEERPGLLYYACCRLILFLYFITI